MYNVKEKNGWVCTDPDCFQYQKKLNEKLFKMISFFFCQEENVYDIHAQVIDLNDYSKEEIQEQINGYYDSIEDIANIYGSDEATVNGIIAECIFEQLIFYDESEMGIETRKKAEKFIYDYISEN